jgi:hypothetical protein
MDSSLLLKSVKSVSFFATPILAALMFVGIPAFGESNAPQSFNLSGQLFELGTNNPLHDRDAKVTIQVLDPSKKCVLYSEKQDIDTEESDGGFNLQIGSFIGDLKRESLDSGSAMSKVFQNTGSIAAQSATGQTCPSNIYRPVAGDARFIRIIVSSHGRTDALSPDVYMGAAPNALVCENIAGIDKNLILLANSANGYALTQANLEKMFTGAAYSNLQSVMNGNFAQTSASGLALPSLASQPVTPATGSVWYDSTSKQIKYYNGSVQTLGAPPAPASSGVTAGSYGDATHVASFTVNSLGQLSAASNVTINAIPKELNSGAFFVGNAANVASAVAASGDVTMSNLGVFSVNGLKGVGYNISGLTAGQFLKYNGTNWQNVGIGIPDVSGLSTQLSGLSSQISSVSTQVSANAGTVLTKDLSAGSIFVGNGFGVASAVSASGDISVDSAGVFSVNGLKGAAFDITDLSDGQILKYSGTKWKNVGIGITDVSGLSPQLASLSSQIANVAGTVSNALPKALAPAAIWVGNAAGTATAVTASGDISVDNAGAFSVTGLKGVSYAISSLGAGQFLKYNGTNWQNVGIGITDVGGLSSQLSNISGQLANSINASQMPPNCAANQTLTFMSPVASWSCTNIALNLSTVSVSGTLPVVSGGTGSNDGSISGSGALNFSAGGTNQNIALSPSGTGSIALNGSVQVTSSRSPALSVGGVIQTQGGMQFADGTIQTTAPVDGSSGFSRL